MGASGSALMDEERLARRQAVDEVGLLRQRVATGEVSQAGLRLAAVLGDDMARAVDGGWEEDCGCGDPLHARSAHWDVHEAGAWVGRIPAVVADHPDPRLACLMTAMALAQLACRERLLSARAAAYVQEFDDFMDGDFNARPSLRDVPMDDQHPPLRALQMCRDEADPARLGVSLALSANWLAVRLGHWRPTEAVRNEVSAWALHRPPRPDWP